MTKCIITILLLFRSLLPYAQDSTRSAQQQVLYQLLAKKHAPADLKADIDTIYQALKQNHPALYLYISKKQLKQKFDSLRSALTVPLTSIQFRSKLIAVLSQIGDSHINLKLDLSSLNALKATDVLAYNESGIAPIMLLKPKIINNRIFVYRNYTLDTTIRPGAEILSIDGMPALEIIRRLLSTYVNTDGYNTTGKYQALNNGYFCEAANIAFSYGDTVRYMIRQDGKTQTHLITRRADTDFFMENEDPAKNFDDDWKINAPGAPMVLTVGRFVKRDQDTFYRSAFKAAARQKVRTLIIDLRNNPGGNIDHLKKLYAFLIDTPSCLLRVKDREYGPVLKRVMEQNPGYGEIYNNISQPVLPADSFRFHGKIYVLINGSSYSAASVLPARLRQLPNVTLVGSETGGNSQGLTALLYDSWMLPNSKLTLRYGLITAVIPGTKTAKGRGVLPDIAIRYQLSDYLAQKDLEMEWVLKAIDREPPEINGYKKTAPKRERSPL